MSVPVPREIRKVKKVVDDVREILDALGYQCEYDTSVWDCTQRNRRDCVIDNRHISGYSDGNCICDCHVRYDKRTET